MKIRLKLALIVGMAMPVLIFSGLALAQTQTPDTPITDQVPNPGEQDDAEAQSAGLNERLQKRKDRLKPQLTFVLRSRVQQRCASSQGILRSTEARVKKAEDNRNRVYGDITGALTELSAKLKADGLDTATLDSQIDSLQKSVGTFKSRTGTHVQAISDLAGMECSSDPEGFWASLEEARSSQKALKKAAQDVKSQFQETIRPTLQELKNQLSGGNGEQGE